MPEQKQTKRKQPPKPKPHKPVDSLYLRFSDVPEISLREWQEHPELQRELEKILKLPVMRIALLLCDSMNPVKTAHGYNPVLLTEHGTAIASLSAGYDSMLHNLKTLSRPFMPVAEVEPTYGVNNPTE